MQSEKQRKRDKQLSGLVRFVKGQSGNPKGRPKKAFYIPDILKKLLDNPINDQAKVTALEAICAKAIFQAIKGDKDARAWIANRLEGMPRQSIELDAKLDQHIKIEDKRKELENLTLEELLHKINESLSVN